VVGCTTQDMGFKAHTIVRSACSKKFIFRSSTCILPLFSIRLMEFSFLLHPRIQTSQKRALKLTDMKTDSPKKIAGIALTSIAILSLGAWMIPNAYYQADSENEFIRNLKKKTITYTEQLPEDRLYMQFDKPFYEPGETMWFSVFVREGTTLKPSRKSDIVHVELINPKGGVEKTLNLIAKDGMAAADFSLDKEVAGGLYKVKAYTNWMKNDGAENALTKEIQVQEVVLPNLKMKMDFEKKAFGAGDEVIAKLELNTNENKALSNFAIKYVANIDGQKFLEKADVTDADGVKYIHFRLPAKLKSNDGLLNVMIDYNGNTESISRSIPIVLNTIALNLFPEGGDLVTGLESNVAFKALNEFGKPADVEGVILTAKGSQVATFSSFHQGMGAFRFTPQPNEKYMAKITRPEGIDATYSLPEAMSRGYVMTVDNAKEGEVGLNVKTTETEELSVVAQERGKIYYSTIVNAKPGSNKLVFNTSTFPMGVAQITLFDSKGIARSERLAFVNREKQLTISVETDKEKYLPREKVKMTVVVKDERGMPMPANLSLAVVNDQLLSFADDKSGNILSQLLLEQDIKEKVEEPAFYFSKKEEKAVQSLDYLMMTAGWRRFTWEKVEAGNIPNLSYPGERAVVEGIVLDASTGKPVPSAKIKINRGAEYEADGNGKFIFNKLDLSSPVNMTCSANGYVPQALYVQNYNQNLVTYLYSNNYYRNYNYAPASAGAVMNAPAGIAEEMDKDDAPRERAHFANKKAGEGAGVRNMRVNAQAAPVALAAKVEKNKIRDLAGFADNQNVVDKEQVGADQKNFAKNERQRVFAQADDRRAVRFAMADSVAFIHAQPAVVYYRARQFPVTVYDKQEKVENRTDFRNTIYWNPDVEVDRTGKKSIEFYASDDITSFRTTVEGIGSDGMPGRAEKTFFTQLPFAMTTKVPVEVATEDNVSIPLTLKNNTDKPLGGVLTITSPEGLKQLVEIPSVQTIMPGAAKTIFIDYKVLDKIGYGEMTIAFKSCGLGDAFTQKIKIAPKGFPVTASFSGQETEKEYTFDMSNVVNGSVQARFTAFPNVVSDLMKGVEGILREPYGCFEQTSMSSYPNAMVLDYLKSTDSKDEKTLANASALLDKGYKRLTTFETKDRGYEWFGSNPGHEALTAYGLMQFTDMKRVGEDVDPKMMERTISWLNSRKDGKGGFLRSKEAADAFGRANEDVTNAYIVYALSEAGFTDISKEFESSYSKAVKSGDPYQLALAACSAYNLKENKKGDEAMEILAAKQSKEGNWTGATHSVTCSTGKSLTVETTSLVIMAIIKSNGKSPGALTPAVQYLVGARSGYGEFGNTQGTILALKALTSYAKFSKKTSEDGTILVYVDGKQVSEKKYKAGEKEAIVIEGLEAHLTGNGQHSVKVKYVGVKTPLPYAVAVNWSTSLPASSKECVVDLKTKLFSKNAQVGETDRLTATITNLKNEGIPSTMAIIGIPAGFTVQPWQLKELQEKKVFDYYEISGNNIAIYYRCMAPKAVKEINLDLKAEMPGEYDAPASSAYLYYTNEFKSWSGTGKVNIRKNNG
jgi:hypothetical protein